MDVISIPEDLHYILDLPEPITVKEGHYYRNRPNYQTNNNNSTWDNSGRIWMELHNKLRNAIRKNNKRLTDIDETQFENWFNTVKTKQLVI